MGASHNIDSTRTIAWQAGASPAALAECQKVALQQQHELLEDAQQRMAAWLRRRQVALETGIDALTRMSACKTPVEMAAICGEWVAGSITRMLADVDDIQAHTVKVAEYFHKATSTVVDSPQAAPAEPAPPAEIRQPADTEIPPVQRQLRAAA